MDTITKFTIPGILFLLTLAFGVWLSNSGKPYNGVLFNIHKLIALGAVIVTAVQVYPALTNVRVQVLIIALVVVAGLCVVALFASGTLLSLGKPMNGAMLLVHQIAPVFVGRLGVRSGLSSRREKAVKYGR